MCDSDRPTGTASYKPPPAAAVAMRRISGVPGPASAASSRLTLPRISFSRGSSRRMPATAPACCASAVASSSSAAAGDGGGAQKPWLFVGLGNPGRMYKGTRHNVGFEMIDAIAEAEGISISSMQFKAMVGKGIGRPTGKMDAINFVLRSFTKQEQDELDFTFHRGLQAVRIMLLEGFNKSATFVNTPQPSEMLNR